MFRLACLAVAVAAAAATLRGPARVNSTGQLNSSNPLLIKNSTAPSIGHPVVAKAAPEVHVSLHSQQSEKQAGAQGLTGEKAGPTHAKVKAEATAAVAQAAQVEAQAVRQASRARWQKASAEVHSEAVKLSYSSSVSSPLRPAAATEESEKEPLKIKEATEDSKLAPFKEAMDMSHSESKAELPPGAKFEPPSEKKGKGFEAKGEQKAARFGDAASQAIQATPTVQPEHIYDDDFVKDKHENYTEEEWNNAGSVRSGAIRGVLGSAVLAMAVLPAMAIA